MSISIDLSGEIAMVTGGRRGIGFAIAETLAKAGAHVIILARNLEQSEEAANKLVKKGLSCSALAANVACVEDVQRAVNILLDKHKKIDILVNCAGVDVTVPAVDATEEQWNTVIDTNLKGAFFCSKAVGRGMIERQKGKIISIASIISLVVKPKEVLYGASKGGLVQMTRCLAAEWAPYNVNVNAVSPGSTPTELNRDYLAIEENYRRNISKIPMGRLGKVEEIAGTVLFLASELSSYVTGQNIFVDGGWTLGW